MLEQDQKLVQDAQQDPANFAALYDKYFDQIYRYVYRRVSDKETVHDLVSQTFFDALSHIKSFEWRGYPFSSWLYKIAHNNVLKWYREQSKGHNVGLDEIGELADLSVDQVRDASRKEKQLEVQKVIDQLDHEEREIIRLKFFEEVSNIEIAEIMGLSANHIGVKVYRTLKKVKQLLKS
ncbi:MAG: sigma-70 family RNA polymerase sigma factor [Candidatus Gracilibacteria bacterium]